MRRVIIGGIVVVLAISSAVAIVLMWGGRIDERIEKIDDYSRYPHYPFYVSISADGSHIVANYWAPNGFVQLFSRADNSTMRKWLSPTQWLGSSSISADGNYIAVGTQTCLYLFSRENDAPLWSTPILTSTTAMSSDGSYIAAGGGNTVYLFSREDNELLWSSSVGEIESVSISADGNYVAVGTWAGLYLFGRENSSSFWSYTGGRTWQTSVSSDGSTIAALVKESTSFDLMVFGKEDNALLWSFPAGSTSLAISDNGSYIASGGGQTLYLFSQADNVPLWSYTTESIEEYSWLEWDVSISSDGNYIAVMTREKHWLEGLKRGKIYLFSQTSNTPLWSYEFPERTGPSSVSISADGNYVAVGVEGGPRANVGGSVYMFSKDNNNPLWSYHHEVEPYPQI